MDNQIHETQISQIKFNPKKTSPRHIITSKIKDKERILKTTKEKFVT